jgi:acyl-CoA thioesterase
MTQSDPSSPTLDEMRQNAEHSGYFTLLGMQISTAQNGKGVVRIQVNERLMHPQMIVHGGVIFALADTAMSWALISTLPPATPVTTIEAKINYLLPVRTGELEAEATVIHKGRSTAVLESTVYNITGEERTAVARILGTFNFPRR